MIVAAQPSTPIGAETGVETIAASAQPMSASLIGRFGVKRFQTIHHDSVDVAHGLVLLFGIGTRALVWGFFSQEV